MVHSAPHLFNKSLTILSSPCTCSKVKTKSNPSRHLQHRPGYQLAGWPVEVGLARVGSPRQSKKNMGRTDLRQRRRQPLTMAAPNQLIQHPVNDESRRRGRVH